jgi:transposase
MMAMEATFFTCWIHDLLPHAEKVKVAHSLMLQAPAAAKKENGRIDCGKIVDCLRDAFLPSATRRRPRRPQPTR